MKVSSYIQLGFLIGLVFFTTRFTVLTYRGAADEHLLAWTTSARGAEICLMAFIAAQLVTLRPMFPRLEDYLLRRNPLRFSTELHHAIICLLVTWVADLAMVGVPNAQARLDGFLHAGFLLMTSLASVIAILLIELHRCHWARYCADGGYSLRCRWFLTERESDEPDYAAILQAERDAVPSP